VIHTFCVIAINPGCGILKKRKVIQQLYLSIMKQMKVNQQSKDYLTELGLQPDDH